MNIVKLNYEDTVKIGNWNATQEWIDSLVEISNHLEKYGFLFNEFKLYIGENKILYKVEIDKDVFSIKYILLEEHKGEKYIFSFHEYLQSMLDLFDNRFDKLSKEEFLESEIGKNLILINFVNYVIYKAMKQEEVLIEETTRKYTKSGNKKSVTNKDRVYSLTECVRKYAKHINHCKHVITCEHWEVRGHYRHLKSGKVVYVKPFEKGKNKNSGLKDKTYRL